MEAVIPGTSREMEAVIPGTSSADAKSPGTRIHEYCQMDQGYQPLYLPQSQHSESWAALLPPRPVRSIAVVRTHRGWLLDYCCTAGQSAT